VLLEIIVQKRSAYNAHKKKVWITLRAHHVVQHVVQRCTTRIRCANFVRTRVLFFAASTATNVVARNSAQCKVRVKAQNGTRTTARHGRTP
jgi:hypothetical protein